MKFTTRQVTTGEVFPISQPGPRRDRDQDAPKPSSLPHHPALRRLHKFRTIVLPILLVLVFTSLILGAIYAYCVAKPHTEIADRLAQNSTAEADGSLFGRRSASFSPSHEHTLRSTTPQDHLETTTASSLPLLFYTLTTPGISLIHLAFELIIHHNTTGLRKPYYLAILTISSLLVAGWITTLGFWMHCELPPLNKSKAAQAICPVQIRGHFMYGIHEVSVVKAVVGWIVVVVYLGHVVLLAMGLKAQRRIWRFGGPGSVEHGEASEIVIRLEEGDIKGTTRP